MKNIRKTKGGLTVRINRNLDKYENVVLFPKKLEQANKLLKGVKIPK